MIINNFRYYNQLTFTTESWMGEYPTPDPMWCYTPTPLMCSASAGADIDLPTGMTAESLGIEVGDTMLNVDPSVSGWGGYTAINAINPAGTTVTVTDNIGMSAGIWFSLFKPKVSRGFVLQRITDFKPNNLINVRTVGGPKYTTWILEPTSSGSGGFPPVVINQLWYKNFFADTPPVSGINGPFIALYSS